MTIVIDRVATFSFTREKNTKQVEMKTSLIKGKLLQPTYKVLTDFVASNVVMILNTDEVVPVESSERLRPAVYVEKAKTRTRARSYVVDFYKTDRLSTLRKLAGAREAEFFDLSENIANWFKEALFWPKTYLFIAQFTVSQGGLSHTFVGILATNLSHGQLAEHEEKILEQIKKGVIAKKIRKGLVFPHLVVQGDELRLEPKAKVFEDQAVPARYFYEFLHLEPPFYAQSLAEEIYAGLKEKGHSVSLRKLTDKLKETREDIPQLVKATITIDKVELRSPLSVIDSALKIAKDNEGYVLIVTGSSLEAKLGKHDLADDLIRLKSIHEIVETIKGRKGAA